jgi:hypothetical protein
MSGFEYYERYPYNERLQQDILALLLQDGTFYNRFYGVWKAKYFTEYRLGQIANSYLTYRKTAKENPSKNGMINLLLLDMEAAVDDVKKTILKFLEFLYEHKIEDKALIESRVIEWGRRASILDGIIRAADILKNDPDGAKAIIDEAYRAGVTLGEQQDLVDLYNFDTKSNVNSLIGDSWLCRGGSVLLIGQSGVGKSALCVQLMLHWSLGKDCLGIKPAGPLRACMIQQENDECDMALMIQGVAKGLDLSEYEITAAKQNIHILRNTTARGKQFLSLVERIVETDKPDIFFIDPLVSFYGGDMNNAEKMGDFLYNGLSVISDKHGTSFFIGHHTGKPFKKSDGGPTTESDLAYVGLGSSVQTNWAREVLVLNRVQADDSDVPTFTLTATKRRKKAGMRSMPSGELTSWITVEHSPKGICWRQRDDIEKKNKKETSPKKKMDDKNEKLKELVHNQFKAVTRNNVNEIATQLKVSPITVWRRWKEVKEETGEDNTLNGNGTSFN